MKESANAAALSDEVPTEESTPRFKKLDSFDIDLVVRTVKNMIDRCEVVTSKKLRVELSENHDLDVKPKATAKCCVRGLTCKLQDVLT